MAYLSFYPYSCDNTAIKSMVALEGKIYVGVTKSVEEIKEDIKESIKGTM